MINFLIYIFGFLVEFVFFTGFAGSKEENRGLLFTILIILTLTILVFSIAYVIGVFAD